eukprot:Hpha_TRINITY_DN10161_c0_g1::TRINITY_DN10161_c0_g1_i1::g.131683::m.131683
MAGGLVAAAEKGDIATLRAIAGGVEKDALTSALEAATKKQQWQSVRILGAAGATCPPALLLELIAAGNVEGTAALVDGAEAKDEGEPAVLAAAAAGGEVLTFFLERGSDPNAKGKGGITALHVAAQKKAVDDVKQLLLFGAKAEAAAAGETPQALCKGEPAIVRELDRKPVDADQAKVKSERFKAQGNKVFGEGEYVKGGKFYSLAIAYDKTNHALFSNRSACFFNRKMYDRALADATHCIRLSPKWAKGYFRKGSCLQQLGDLDAAMDVVQTGLKHDPKQKDLIKLREDLKKDLQAKAAAAKK